MTEHKTIDLLDIVLVLVQNRKKVIAIMSLFYPIGFSSCSFMA